MEFGAVTDSAPPAGRDAGRRSSGGRQPAATHIQVLGLVHDGWTTLLAPSPDRPRWTDEHGSVHALRGLLVGVDDDTGAQIRRAHVDAVAQLTDLAIARMDAGLNKDARRLVSTASRLVEEVVGFWPPEAGGPA